MSERIHGLAQHLLGKSSIDECSLEELQHLTERYPYFAPAQFLLLQKLKAAGSPDFETQQRKAVLYYHDPLQFDFFISSEKFYTDEVSLHPTEYRTNSEDAIVVDEVLPADVAIAEEHAVTQKQFPPESEEENIAINDANPERGRTDEAKQKDNLHPNQETLSFNPHPVLVEPDKVKNADEIEIAEPTILHFPPFGENTHSAKVLEEPHKGEEANAIIVEPSVDVVPVKEDNIEAATRSESKGASASSTLLTETKDEPLAFEPYYTVDYFASQGIKGTTDNLPKDKLAKQLRSFTEWLKVMKRLPVAEITQSPQSSAEKSVETMASHSVEGSDVITEAMAEVWAKQGAREKAIETYNKLSLLNPSKKAYFAAKIENLSRS